MICATSLSCINFGQVYRYISNSNCGSETHNSTPDVEYCMSLLTTCCFQHFYSTMTLNMAISLRRIIRFTPCLVLGWGFRGRWIEWCYSRFHQAAALENSNGDISAVDHPIYSVFGSRMGFSGSVDRMVLFPVSPSRLGKFKWRYLGVASSHD